MRGGPLKNIIFLCVRNPKLPLEMISERVKERHEEQTNEHHANDKDIT